MEMIKKITTKTLLGFVPDAPARGSKETVWLYRVIGRAINVKGGESAHGPYEFLQGEFIGQAFDDKGQIDEAKPAVRAPKLFLPEIAHFAVAPAVMAADGPVEFGFKVGIKRDDTAATKYVYTAESLITPKETDPLMVLAEETGFNVAMLLEDKSNEKKDN